MISFCSLFSGSSGNASILRTDEGAVLVDCGMSGKQILQALESVHISPLEIKALLITHEHSDHVKGAGIISRKLGIPIYATEGTWEGMAGALGNIPLSHRVAITPGESFFLPGMEVAPFTIPHDANEPVGYRFYLPGHSVAVATDMGYFSDTARKALLGAEVVLLESNHDPDMVRQNPRYPNSLKNRILGRKGHLSNESGAAAAADLVRNGTRHVLLGHLSPENNTPEMAYTATHFALTQTGARVGRDVTLYVAGRLNPSYLYTIP